MVDATYRTCKFSQMICDGSGGSLTCSTVPLPLLAWSHRDMVLVRKAEGHSSSTTPVAYLVVVVAWWLLVGGWWLGSGKWEVGSGKWEVGNGKSWSVSGGVAGGGVVVAQRTPPSMSAARPPC